MDNWPLLMLIMGEPEIHPPSGVWDVLHRTHAIRAQLPWTEPIIRYVREITYPDLPWPDQLALNWQLVRAHDDLGADAGALQFSMIRALVGGGE